MLLHLSLLCLLFAAGHGKTYKRCELAKELVANGVKRSQVATWVCIAKHESRFDTAAVGYRNADQSKDYGIFQINDKFWCSPPGTGKGCGLPCSALQDNSIADDLKCAKKVFAETKRLKGNGFSAWTVYSLYCNKDVQSYVKGCFKSRRSIRLPTTPSSEEDSEEFREWLKFDKYPSP